jgi:hypothetical protein
MLAHALSSARRMAPTLAVLAAVFTTTLAVAGSTVDVQTPLGKTIKADVVKAPAADTPDYAIVQTIKMLSAGEMDAWMDAWCYAPRCETAEARDSMKAYQLASAQKNAAKCLHDDDTLWVTARKSNPNQADEQRIFTHCGDDRMPVPTVLKKTDAGWKVSTLGF